MACYANYTSNKQDPDDCYGYDVSVDWHGPQFWAPS